MIKVVGKSCMFEGSGKKANAPSPWESFVWASASLRVHCFCSDFSVAALSLWSLIALLMFTSATLMMFTCACQNNGLTSPVRNLWSHMPLCKRQAACACLTLAAAFMQCQ